MSKGRGWGLQRSGLTFAAKPMVPYPPTILVDCGITCAMEGIERLAIAVIVPWRLQTPSGSQDGVGGIGRGNGELRRP